MPEPRAAVFRLRRVFCVPDVFSEAAGFDFPPATSPPCLGPFLRTNLISIRLSKACATRINVPIVRFRVSFSIAEIFGALISSRPRPSAFHRFFQYPEAMQHVTISLPDELLAAFSAQGQDFSRAALEALALEAYRSRKISTALLRQLLGFQTR